MITKESDRVWKCDGVKEMEFLVEVVKSEIPDYTGIYDVINFFEEDTCITHYVAYNISGVVRHYMLVYNFTTGVTYITEAWRN